ncbi:MAG: L,D-transpeptidase family protein [Burkholderiaceae bacterium]
MGSAVLGMGLALAQPAIALTRDCPSNLSTMATPIGWTEAGHPGDQAMLALKALLDAGRHGLDPADYQATDLAARAWQLGRTDDIATRQDDLARFERDLSDAIHCYLAHLGAGRLDGAAMHRRLPRLANPSTAEELLVAVRSGMLARHLENAAPDSLAYRSLQRSLIVYKGLAHQEAASAPTPIRLVGRLELGTISPQLEQVRARLRFLGDNNTMGSAAGVETVTDGSNPAHVFDHQLKVDVQRFQRRHGLTDDGIIGPATAAAMNVPMFERVKQIELALERLRWLPRQTEGTVVRVNLPEFRLQASGDGRLDDAGAFDSRVVIGRSARNETPLYVGRLERIEFSPYWYIPYSIATKEILPRLRRDPGYLARNNMEAVLGKGRTTDRVTAGLIAGVQRGSINLRQKPGAGNALGRVKFVLPDSGAIYLHDTQSRSLFGRDRRDFSHGCVRVEKPAELAQLMLANDPHWTAERVGRALRSERPIWVEPSQPVTVMLTYLTAVAAGDGSVRFLPDIYGLDAKALQTTDRWAANHFVDVDHRPDQQLAQDQVNRFLVVKPAA